MAAEKDSQSAQNEHNEFNDLGMGLGDGSDYSTEMVELKNRMDKSDQEMRAMTEAMKSTLLDVRTLMQDMDNPFNMLRDMGVDKLVNKAVETVEDEVNKQKREETKKRLAGEEDEKDPIVAKVEGQTGSVPGYGGGKQLVDSEPSVSEMRGESYAASQGVSGGGAQGGMVMQESLGDAGLMYCDSALSYLDERLGRTEESIQQLASTVSTLADAVKKANPPRGGSVGGVSGESASDNGDYYEAYVSLVADYIELRFGERGSEELLLEGMYKEWASPKVVRDIMDKLSTKTRKVGLDEYGLLSSDIEDKMLVTSLLKSLDRPVSEWSDTTHLFLLLALVSRARENKVNKVEK